jgi:hypothetical protein
MSANFHPLTSTTDFFKLQIHFDIYLYKKHSTKSDVPAVDEKDDLCLLTKSLSPPMSLYNA